MPGASGRREGRGGVEEAGKPHMISPGRIASKRQRTCALGFAQAFGAGGAGAAAGAPSEKKSSPLFSLFAIKTDGDALC